MNDGLDELRQRYPAWTMGLIWVPRSSAGDYCQLRAQCGDTTVEAYDAMTLGARIAEAEQSVR